jgi:hypothetical protein
MDHPTDPETLSSLIEALEGLLGSRIGVIEASRRISSARFALMQERNPLFLPFVGIDSETDHFPIDAVRARWAPEALARYDRERQIAERHYEITAAKAARALLDWLRAQTH